MKIAIVDDHSIVLEGFKRLLETESFTISFIARSLAEARKNIPIHECDLVILDLSLPDGVGIEFIADIQNHHPHCKILVTSMYDKEPYPSKAMEAGAHGYISKNEAADELLDAITHMQNDRTYLGKDILANLKLNANNKQIQSVSELTSRELVIFKYLALGYSVKSIAKFLDIMPKTVHSHRANILTKLDVKENVEMLKLAVETKLIDLHDLHKTH